MVLKKSNSPINSGATQRRVTHRGVYIVRMLGRLEHYDNYLNLTAGLADHDDDNKSHLSAFLENMYEYLNLDVDSLPCFVSGNKVRRRDTTLHLQELSFSLDKRKMWQLPEQIKNMMANVDFLTTNSDTFDLKLSLFQGKGKFSPRNPKKVISASEVIAKSSESGEPKTGTEKSRTRHTYHGRGVQRPHLFHSSKLKKDESRQPTQGAAPVKQIGYVNLSLHESLHIDSRNVYCRKKGKKFSDFSKIYHQLKSSTKIKGRNKGKKPSRKGYCSADFHEDKMDGMNNAYDEYNGSMLFSENEEEEQVISSSTLPTTSCDIFEFISTEPPRQRRQNKVNKNKSRPEPENGTEDSHSNDMIRYPKGSFIVVPKEEFEMIESSSSWDIIDKEEIDMSVSHLDYCTTDKNQMWLLQNDTKDTIPEDEHTQLRNLTKMDIMKEITEFDDSFVQVDLEMFDNEQNWFSPSEDRNIEELISNRCGIFIGDSFPPCLVVDLCPEEKNENGQFERILLGRKTGVGGSKWLVSIQDKTLKHAQTKQQLEQLIVDHQNTSMTLSDLIELAKSVVSEKDLDKPASCGRFAGEQQLSSYTVWNNLSKRVPYVKNICTVEEVCQKFQEDDMKVTEFNGLVRKQNTTTALGSLVDLKSAECSICFTSYNVTESAKSMVVLFPCSHAFCVGCWREHIYHAIGNGANRIVCMETSCTNVMDSVTAFTIAPCDLLWKWQSQIKERRIDSSPYCSWCPNVACGKVAMSGEGIVKSQFGIFAVCECKRCWCCSCLEEPHWPASCDQMAAYKKLLAKTDKKLQLGIDDKMCEVNVKKCPNCKYPIEKNEGCPSMMCSMCNYLFCWNCLKASHTHGICDVQNVKTVTYTLQNTLEITLPLQHFPDCLMFIRKRDSIQKMKPWFMKLQLNVASLKLKSKQGPTTNISVIASRAKICADECVSFLLQAYTFQEMMHVLADFAKLNKRDKRKIFVAQALSKIFRLDFIACRLEEKIIGKSVTAICKYEEAARYLVKAGYDIISELSLLVPVLQNLSKDIETAWVGELDPNTAIRYR